MPPSTISSQLLQSQVIKPVLFVFGVCFTCIRPLMGNMGNLTKCHFSYCSYWNNTQILSPPYYPDPKLRSVGPAQHFHTWLRAWLRVLIALLNHVGTSAFRFFHRFIASLFAYLSLEIFAYLSLEIAGCKRITQMVDGCHYSHLGLYFVFIPFVTT